jgi:tRNA(fMet)-specific endonuclease VapC
VILSLDANVMIDICNGRAGVRERFDEAVNEGSEIVASPVASHELLFGCLISPRPQHHLDRAQALLADLRRVDLTHEDSLAAARIRRDLRRQGRSIGAYDLLIAGQALNRGWTMVSANLREYTRVENLRVVDWTRPASHQTED